MRIDYDSLRQAVACSKLTQQQIAQRAGLSDQTISRFMCGKRQPRPFTVALIAAAIGADPAQFFRRDEN